MRILIIEDERKVASFIKRGLEENGYETDTAYDGEVGISKATAEDFDLIILDLNLPKVDGYQVCQSIRSHKSVPILMLTAFGSLDNKVSGLDAGADDYLIKPFEFRELLARMNALIRRATMNSYGNNVFTLADLKVDFLSKAVTRGNKKIDLTAKEFNLLEYFIKNQGKVLSRAEIAETVWNLNFDTGTNIIDVYVNYLRRKIDKGFHPKLIHTLVGMGYVMKIEDERY